MPAWNEGEVALVPAAPRYRTSRLLLPVLKSAASRLATCADCELLSSHPPESSSPDAWEAQRMESSAAATVRTTTTRRNR